jgi:hypothetical protein
MYRNTLSPIILATLVTVGCGKGGYDHWLYPEPRLPETEEALFVAQQNHGLLSIDGDETGLRCWGDREGVTSQPYGRRDLFCRLHIRAGQHSVLARTSLNGRGTERLEFTALPGKVYGITRSNCTSIGDGSQQRCQVEVVEVKGRAGG